MQKKDRRKLQGYAGLAALLLLYIAAAVIIPRISRSDGAITIGQAQLPVATFTGVLSSLANICIICLVFFYRKPGFIIALTAILAQIPIWARNVILNRNMAVVPGVFSTLLTIVAIIVIRSRDKRIEMYRQEELEQLTEQQKQAERLFEQTAKALVTAIDAKDEYSHGHSMRVAEYARRIAEKMGKSEEECRKVYYAGLLHDVGKIGINDAIITKKENLTTEEYEEIKKHPVLGNQILSSIPDYPYISIGAHYHHERYDGTGYPDGLKGEAIPEIARIISVADTYDTLSSNRSYRRPIPQHMIREEIIAGAGTQFDPAIARIMKQLIDEDAGYHMKEREAAKELIENGELHCGAYRSEITEGILVGQEIIRIRLAYRKEVPGDRQPVPAVILFDSLDERVHDGEKMKQEMNYFEYCEIRIDGNTVNHGARKIKTEVKEKAPASPEESGKNVCGLEAVRVRDHLLVRIHDGQKTTEVTTALPDSSRFAYLALTGENCHISELHIDKSGVKVPDDYIPRIADEISYIDGPEGDIPNVQVDSIRSAATEGIPLGDGMRLTFHTRSLPTARLIWHCPYIVLFHSANGKVGGEGYREYSVIRLDGEEPENGAGAQNRIAAVREKDFEGWDAWKKGNMEGFDCTVLFVREENKITVSTKNLGLAVKSVTILPEAGADRKEPVYAALTGDQCALTNIRIFRSGS